MPNANRTQKEKLVQEMHGELKSVQAAVIAQFSGINVAKITALRGELREKNIGLKVMKNTLASRAIEGLPLASLKEHFKGPTALAYTAGDPVVLAKILTTFAKSEEKFLVRAGLLGEVVMSKAQVEALAAVPSREILLGRLVGSLASPYAGLVYTLSGVLRKFVYALEAVRRKKEQEGK